MATAKPVSRRRKAKPRRRPWPRLLAIGVLLLGGLAFLYRAPLAGFTVTGASYGARVACSCRFVAGRSMKDCAKDKEPGMGLLILRDDPAARSVTARFPLLPAQTARLKDGYGCMLDRWEG